jgi:hypothetical protein
VFARQPVKQLWQPDFEGIDVPGGEFQRVIATLRQVAPPGPAALRPLAWLV